MDTNQRSVVFKPLAWVLLSVSFLFGFTGAANAATVAGVSLDENLTINDSNLVLNGAGIRKKLFFKLYVGGLYVPSELKGNDAQSITDADASMLIQMNILSELLTRDKMVDALESGFSKSTGGNTEAIDEHIETLKSALDDALAPGDVVQVVFDAATDTSTLLQNGESKVTIPGLEFKQALFGIWLSDTPVQASLKKAMLGQK